MLREAVASGVNHIDTSDYYGPHVTNQLIREALHPYPDDLVIVTKIGARRGRGRVVEPGHGPEDLESAVHDNLRNLGLDVLEVVNLRIMGSGPRTRRRARSRRRSRVLAELQRQGLVRHIGLSNVTPKQIAEGRRICDIVCVQNMYNVAHREDDALIDELAASRHRLCAVLPARRLHAVAVDGAERGRHAARRDADAGRARLAPPARAQHPAHPRHFVARTFARKPGRGQPRAAGRRADRAGRDREGPRAGITVVLPADFAGFAPDRAPLLAQGEGKEDSSSKMQGKLQWTKIRVTVPAISKIEWEEK